ncbi:MAG: hypothetical protein RIQ60_2207 [Pseudomonadota bacterium]|jgi:hypothetical protein
MLYKFKSRATGDLIMTTPVGDRVLIAAGREPSPQGIIEPVDMPGVIAAIEAAIHAEEEHFHELERQAEAAGLPPPQHKDVGLRQRAWPLVEMCRRSYRADKPIVWGA